MTKFKVGDKIIARKSKIVLEHFLGKVGVIKDIDTPYGDNEVLGVKYGDGDYQVVYSWWDAVELVKENNMTEDSNQFVGTTKVIKEVINTFDSGGAKMSIEPTTKANVRLTVGAEYRHGGANCFNKRTLQELIHNLQEVCDLMES